MPCDVQMVSLCALHGSTTPPLLLTPPAAKGTVTTCNRYKRRFSFAMVTAHKHAYKFPRMRDPTVKRAADRGGGATRGGNSGHKWASGGGSSSRLEYLLVEVPRGGQRVGAAVEGSKKVDSTWEQR